MGKIEIKETANQAPEEEKVAAAQTDKETTPEKSTSTSIKIKDPRTLKANKKPESKPESEPETKPNPDDKPKEESKPNEKPEAKQESEPDPEPKPAVSSAEAERISDDADALEDAVPVTTEPEDFLSGTTVNAIIDEPSDDTPETTPTSEPEKTTPLEPKTPTPKKSRNKKGTVVDGVLAPYTAEPKTELPEEILAEAPTSGEPRFSKPKALLIAAGVALGVGVLGGFLVWAVTHKEAPRCVVQFDSYGGSLIESEEIVCGRKVASPSDPTKEGFIFQGWVLEGDDFNFDRDSVSKDIILIAKWQRAEGTETVTVSFNSNGGTEVKPREIAKGKTMTAPIAPIRSGYSFAGWFLNDKAFDFSTPIQSNITLTARWNKDRVPAQPTATTEKDTKLTSVQVSNQSFFIGEGKDVNVTVVPASAKYSLRVDSNSDSSVATCLVPEANKSQLNCSALKVGSTEFTIVDDVSGKTTTFKLTVNPILVANISLAAPGNELEVDGTLQITAVVTPEEATNKLVDWFSSNDNIATISSGGLVTAKAPGTVTITAIARDSSGVTGSLDLTVKPKPEPEPPVEPTPTTVTISGAPEGNTVTTDTTDISLSATVTAAEGVDTTVTWSSNNEDVATVAADGKVTIKAAGEVTITATADGQTATLTLTITTPAPADPGTTTDTDTATQAPNTAQTS